MSDSEDDAGDYGAVVAGLTEEDEVPQRTSSAPPVLEVQEQSLFAMGNNYARLFAGAADIRADDDYIHFYNSHPDPSKLPPPFDPSLGDDFVTREVRASRPPILQTSSSLSSTYANLPLVDGTDTVQPYSPVMSPPMARAFLPYSGDERDTSPRWSRPMPQRAASISSLEDYSLDETSLIPDLSSDSESISSSIDDISALVQNMGATNGVSVAAKLAAKKLWEAENVGTRRSSYLVPWCLVCKC